MLIACQRALELIAGVCGFAATAVTSRGGVAHSLHAATAGTTHTRLTRSFERESTNLNFHDMTATDLLEFLYEQDADIQGMSRLTDYAMWRLGLASAADNPAWVATAQREVKSARNLHFSAGGHGTLPLEAELRSRLCGCQCEHSPRHYKDSDFESALASFRGAEPHVFTQTTYDWLTAAKHGLPSEGERTVNHLRGVLINLDPNVRARRNLLDAAYRELAANQEWYPENGQIPRLQREARHATAAWIEEAVRTNARLNFKLQIHHCECECEHGRVWA